MPESLKEKILYALELQKYLTVNHFVNLLLPTDIQPHERKKAWEKIRKSVQRLQKENLLSSKSFGLGKYNLLCLADNPVIKKLGYTPPNKEIHPLFYEHEIIRGDLFVAVVQSGQMLEWEWEPKVKRFIPDAMFKFDTDPIFVEVERGKQHKAKLIIKVQNYLNYYRETRERFHVLFVVSDDLEDLIARIFDELGTPSMYLYATAESLIPDILNAEIKSRTTSLSLSHLLPTDETD